MDSTTRLLLQKPNPDPVTGDFVDISVLNSNADKIDAAISATVCTSGTRPASPFDGQIIRESDTRAVYIRNATQAQWDRVLAASGNGIYIDVPTNRLQFDTDTNLYRSGANALKTDDSFEADAFRLANGQAWVMTYSDEVLLASAMNALTISTVDVTGCSLTFTTRKANAVMKAYYTFDFQTAASAAGTNVGRIAIDAVDLTDSQAIYNAGNTTAGSRATVSGSKRAVLAAAGSHTVKLRVTGGVASGANLMASHTKLIVEVFE